MLKIEIYRSGKEFRSRIKSSNGKIRFDSGESNKRRYTIVKSILNLIRDIRAGEYEIVTIK